jgi:hypothetical protein
MRVPSVVSLILTAAVVVSCDGSDSVSAAIGNLVRQGPGTRLALPDATGFPWERVCIVGPYTGAHEVDAMAGTEIGARIAHGISERDDIDLLLFISNGRVVRSTAHPRNHGDFGPEVVGKCYSRREAVFAVRKVPPGSWGNIGPL